MGVEVARRDVGGEGGVEAVDSAGVLAGAVGGQLEVLDGVAAHAAGAALRVFGGS